jgi:hypothetical protein
MTDPTPWVAGEAWPGDLENLARAFHRLLESRDFLTTPASLRVVGEDAGPHVGSLTTVTKKSSMCRTTSMKRS